MLAAGDTTSTKHVTNVGVVQPHLNLSIILHLYCKQVGYKECWGMLQLCNLSIIMSLIVNNLCTRMFKNVTVVQPVNQTEAQVVYN